MNFPDSYFEDEVRDGFYVPGMMKRSWAADLEILDAVRQVCEKHRLSYFADWGTVLGAVRHGGMVPWDDDIDICMKRKDYEKFLEIAEKELPEGYSLMNYRTHDTDNMVTKIINYPLYVLPEEDQLRFHGYPYMASIDLFAMDFLPRTKKGQDILWDFAELVAQLNYRIELNEVDTEEVQHALQGVEKICGITLDREAPLKRQLVKAMEDFAAENQEESCDEITEITYFSDNRSFRFPKSYFINTMELPFEGASIPVPVEYGELLCRKYGTGFMTPLREFDTHEYPGYKVIHEMIREKLSIEPYQYRFSRQEMEQAEGERQPKETLRTKVEGFLPLFREAHEGIRQMIRTGAVDSAAEILGECQNVAIQIGTMIEEQCGEGHATVAILERYCETVFRLHESISGGGSPSDPPDSPVLPDPGHPEEIRGILEELEESEKRLAESAIKDIREKKEVVFVPYKTAYWDAMESVWQAAAEDEDTEVYVIPAPYYYKDELGKIKRDEPQYETDYPEGVRVTSYEEYNFEVHHPDMVVIQCPYDEYSYGMTIHPFFYARNLKKYTEQLVYIPPFAMDEIRKGDERGRMTLRHFCNMPGVVHADRVIVQSEQMKEVYVELLTEFAGEETREMWEEKIQGTGSPVQDREGRDPFADIAADALPEEWHTKIYRPDGSRKKIILYVTTVSALFSHGDQAVDKMREVFRVFRENQEDVVVWWRPDPKVREVMRKTKPGALQKYRELLQEYRDNRWGIYDDSTDIEKAVRLCDAYYGDAGSTANLCRNQGKPVMFQNVTV